ncbi:hypothetical protein K1719_029852 [Acacia pycnantha]|nr:hypothetical protein K1719_029852 [Acacia pycnantha]
MASSETLGLFGDAFYERWVRVATEKVGVKRCVVQVPFVLVFRRLGFSQRSLVLWKLEAQELQQRCQSPLDPPLHLLRILKKSIIFHISWLYSVHYHFLFIDGRFIHPWRARVPFALESLGFVFPIFLPSNRRDLSFYFNVT